MRFRVLGGVAATVGGRPLTFARRTERCLLGLLLLEAGRTVTVDRLVDLLWEPDTQPTQPRRSVHSHVSRVRSVINRAGDPTVRLTTQGAGYLLDVDPATVDAHRFRELVAVGTATGDPAARVERLAAALDLWRGPVLGDDAGAALRERVGAGLEALRLSASEQWLAALLELGRHHEALPELARLVVEQPTRERFVELEMTALYQVGRKAEALAAYERTRSWLVGQLGIEPTPTLRKLHQAVLRDEVAPTATTTFGATGNAPSSSWQVPAELPARPSGFVGRAADLATLDSFLERPEGPTSAVVVAVIAGTAGVGKTALATHFAHQVADRYPDGQLHVNLRGYDEAAPRTPLEVLTRLLASLGVPVEQIPVEEEAAAARYRSRLAGRRVLVVLDNAASAAQVRPLLPADPGCLALVTSRDRLTGLVASHGARRLMLETLSPREARALLAETMGADRLAAAPRAVTELAELCAHLPLALRIAAANLANRPHGTIEDYVATLRSDRLGGLAIDGNAAVRAAFELSYTRLDPATRRMFRLLGLMPGPDISVAAAAALAGTSTAEAARSLDHVARTHLVEEHRPRRYTFHDLLRLHARERAEVDESADGRQAASERLHTWYLTHAARAAMCLQSHMCRLPETESLASRATVDFDKPGAAAWLDAERANLAAAVGQLAETGPRKWVWLLVDALRGYFLMRTDVADWLPTAYTAMRAAAAAGDLTGQAAAQLSIADAHRRHSQFDSAVPEYLAAAELSRRAGWFDGEFTAHTNLATAYLERGEPRLAEPHLRASIAVEGPDGGSRGLATAVANLGVICADFGRLAEAEVLLQRAVALRRQGASSAAPALNNLSALCRYRGQFDEALRYGAEALAEHRTSGFLLGEAIVLDTVARARRDAGDLAGARRDAEAALTLARRCNTPRIEADAHNTLGTVHAGSGSPRQAVAAHQQALRLATEGHAQDVEVEAWVGLGAAYLAAGEDSSALTCVRQGLDLARRTGFRIWELEASATLAQIHHARGERAHAVSYAREALALFRETGYQLGAERVLAIAGE